MNSRHRQMTFMTTMSALLLLVFSSVALAYPDYGGCQSCHGGFDGRNYTSKTDGTPWNQNLMEGHEEFVDSCNACHKTGDKESVYLNFSIDSTLSKSCVGCHGRDEDVNGSCVGGSGTPVECGSGTGLRRMHEINVGAGTCQSCHSGDPAPVGEQANPFYYGKSDVQMLDACDADSSESQYGANGLDNDGDGQIDGADSDCQAVKTDCAELGPLAYDNWTKTDAGGSGSLPAGATSADYIRCKACHGWDHMGTDGGYARRSRNAGRPNAGAGDTDQTSRNISLAARENADVTADMIWHTGTGRLFTEGAGSWVDLDDTHSAANKAAHSSGYTLGNQHPDFTNGALTQEQVGCLVEFLNNPSTDPAAYFSHIDTGTNPALYSIIATADAVAGESYYNTNCVSCHGDPAGVSPVGAPDGGILAYLEGDGKFSEFAHKARWGIPNTTMTRASMGSPDATDVADMMLWLQQSGGNGFVINPGLSGNWWGGLARSGEGFLIDVGINFKDDTILVVSFYTYDTIGNQVWLIGNGQINGNTSEMALFIPEGAKWGAAYNPDDSDEIPWGTGTFRFTSCGAGHIALVPNEVMQNNGFTNLEYDISRDILMPGIECPTPTN